MPYFKDLAFGPYEVNLVDSFVLNLKDGEKISINVWFPGNSADYFPRHEATVRYCNAQEQDFEAEVGKVGFGLAWLMAYS